MQSIPTATCGYGYRRSWARLNLVTLMSSPGNGCPLGQAAAGPIAVVPPLFQSVRLFPIDRLAAHHRPAGAVGSPGQVHADFETEGAAPAPGADGQVTQTDLSCCPGEPAGWIILE